MAAAISDMLQMHLRSSGASLETLRANPLYLLIRDPIESSYPVVEWRESDGTESVAIFYMDYQEECVRCKVSWLMHSVIHNDGNRNQGQLRLNWSVSDISHISKLFILSNHLLGVLQWTQEDILNLYCHQNFGDCELSEYNSYFELVTNVLDKRDALHWCTTI